MDDNPKRGKPLYQPLHTSNGYETSDDQTTLAGRPIVPPMVTARTSGGHEISKSGGYSGGDMPRKGSHNNVYSISTSRSMEETPDFDKLANILIQNNFQQQTFLMLRLKTQISKFHVASYYLMVFTIFLIVQFIVAFLMFILESPEYYDIPKDKVASIAGNCGFIAEIFVICFSMILGLIFDTVGRKAPTVIGFLVCGASIIATPFFKEVYPGFLLMRIFMSLGIIPGVNTPLLPDYIHEKSLGLANAYQSLVGGVARIAGTTGLIQLSKHSDLKWIFLGMGASSICIGVFLIFGIRDIITLKKKQALLGRSGLTQATPGKNRHMQYKAPDAPPKSSNMTHFRKIIRQFWRVLTTDAGFTVAIIGSFCCKLAAIVCGFFASLLVQSNYEKEYGPGEIAEEKAKELLSWMFLVANTLQVVLGLILGYLSDKMRVWVLLTICNFTLLGFGIMFLLKLHSTSTLFVVGLVGVEIIHQTIYMLSLIMLSKLVKPDSRGTLYGAFSLVGSLGVLLINEVGGILYDKHAHIWPFAISIGSFAVLTLLTLLLGLFGKLRV